MDWTDPQAQSRTETYPPDAGLLRRLPQELRRDVFRLSTQEAWEEMLLSLAVTVTMFAGIWAFMEWIRYLHF